MKNKLIVLVLVFTFLFSAIAYAEMCEVAHVRTNLKKMLFEYFESPSTAQVELGKVKDLLDFYLQIPTDEIEAECSGIGTNSNVSYSIIVDEGDTVTTAIPYCSDGTEFGTCANETPYYCYNGRLIDRCNICECSDGVCQEDGSCFVESYDNETKRCDVKIDGIIVKTVYATDRNDCYNQTSFGSINCNTYTPYFSEGTHFLEQYFDTTDRVNNEYCICVDGICDQANQTSCGDSTCDVNENCSSCSEDCGSCPVDNQTCIDTNPYPDSSGRTEEQHITNLVYKGTCTDHNDFMEESCGTGIEENYVRTANCYLHSDLSGDTYECSNGTFVNCQAYGFQHCEDGACVDPTFCGDGYCLSIENETCSSCPEDCGTCFEGCYDTDPTNMTSSERFGQFGTCTDDSGTYEDYCYSETMIVDVYCSPTSSPPASQTCSSGGMNRCSNYGFDKCVDGACVNYTG